MRSVNRFPRVAPHHPRARRFELLILLACIASWAGCASLPDANPDLSSAADRVQSSASSVVNVAPNGPGHVFPTIESAAMDALTYSFLLSRKTQIDHRRPRGGAIFPADGGFSYAEPIVARDKRPNGLRYRLQPTDVAHFRHHPNESAFNPRKATRMIRNRDRTLVDRRDPLHRPIYSLTPKRFVQVY